MRKKKPSRDGTMIIFVRHSETPYMYTLDIGEGPAYMEILAKDLKDKDWVWIDDRSCIRCADIVSFAWRPGSVTPEGELR